MKKLIFSALSALFILGFVNSPVQVGAASKAPELVETAAEAKYVSVTRFFANSWSAPSSISYNSGGYSGVLYLEGIQNDGERWVAHYSGTVYKCTSSGACMVN